MRREEYDMDHPNRESLAEANPAPPLTAAEKNEVTVTLKEYEWQMTLRAINTITENVDITGGQEMILNGSKKEIQQEIKESKND